MINILYIGNVLSQHGYTKGVIETLGPQLESIGFTVFYGGTKKNPVFRLFQMLGKIITLRNKIQFVLIDTYSTSAFWYAWLSGLICGCFRIKYIPILHGGDMPVRLHKSQLATKNLFNHSFANVAVSGYLKDAFDQFGFFSIIIPNNIEISRYPFKNRELIAPKLLWVRSFHSQYNPNLAADVLSLLLETYPNSELCMVGPDKDGSMEEFKEYAKYLGVLESVKITGVLPKEDWLKLSTQYDFFINTTNVDNTPVSVIEAMALGMCVVSTNVGGIPYILKNNQNAKLVDKNNALGMSNAIVHLLQNPKEAKTLSTNARHTAMNFDWDIVKLKWIELLS